MTREPATSPRILIAEDNELQSAVVRAMLEARGYQAEIVTDGLEAVRRLRTQTYDVALLDYRMPAIDGLAAARLLHDVLAEGQRPRLIGVTVAAEELSAKDAGSGGGVFDAVVSKRLGLSVLLDVIDANLLTASDIKAAGRAALGRKAADNATAARRRRRRAPLAALPGLAMTCVFLAGLAWAFGMLQDVDTTRHAAEHAVQLNASTTQLVDAMQDTEASQRTYLVTGLPNHKQAFEADAQRVDQLLVSPAALTLDEMAGVDADAEPHTVIERRLRGLAEAARLRDAAVAATAPLDPSSGDPSKWLRSWAAGLFAVSQRAVLAGLDAARQNAALVIGVLLGGAGYAAWGAAWAVRRRWREAGEGERLRPLEGGQLVPVGLTLPATIPVDAQYRLLR